MPEHDLADLDRTLTDDAREIMLDVILAWARFDTGLSAWLIQAHGLDLDRGALIVEHMDIGNKIRRLRRLYEHLRKETEVKGLKALKAEFEKQVRIRNTIAHANCVGMSKKHENCVVFSPVAAFLGSPGHIVVESVPIDLMKRSAAFALNSAEAVMKISDALETQPLAPPAQLAQRQAGRSNRQTRRRSKHQPRP